MIKVLSSGLYSSIQDKGRWGHRKSGVPLSGVMDRVSAILANTLLGNDIYAPLMEITQTGPVLQFMEATQISITGAGFTPTLDNVEIPLNKRVRVDKDSTLKFGLPSYGVRGYLAIRGGFISENVLGSFSYYPSVTSRAKLHKGDTLYFNELSSGNGKITASVKNNVSHFEDEILEVFKGPEFDDLSEEIQQTITSYKLKVLPQSNRMAYILEGLEGLSAKEIITAPVQPGTVQLTPSGQCAVLMRDGQTTGGYARILQLSESAISKMSQKSAGSTVRFKFID